MDSFLSFLVKLLIGGLMVLAFVGLWGVGIELSDVSNFKQQVNYTIERDGGLTQQAIREISTYAQEHSHGQYQIKSAQLGQKVPYGMSVGYEIVCTYQTLFLSHPIFQQTVHGNAVSQVRE